jgi:hypothetical protein
MSVNLPADNDAQSTADDQQRYVFGEKILRECPSICQWIMMLNGR